MDSFSTQRLLFLISMGAIPLACGDGGSGSETDPNPGTTSETAGPTTTGPTTDDTTDGGTTAAESSTTMEATTGDDSSVCADYAKARVLCYPMDPYSDFFDPCVASLEEYAAYSPSCLAAGEAWLKCQTTIACGEFFSCVDEETAMTIACTPPPGEVCTSWAAKSTDCYMKTAEEEAYSGLFCQSAILKGAKKHGQACGMAIEDHYACLAALDCAVFESQVGCEGTSAKVNKECPL